MSYGDLYRCSMLDSEIDVRLAFRGGWDDVEILLVLNHQYRNNNENGTRDDDGNHST